MTTKQIAFLQIFVALLFATSIIFLDVSDNAEHWMVLMWFVSSSLIAAVSTKKASNDLDKK